MSQTSKRKQVLGRGFNALISDDFDKSLLLKSNEKIENIGLDKIQPNPHQPRKIAGERRWRAAEAAKLKTIPAIVRSSKELEQLEIALIENVQRVDLSPLEQAASIGSLRNQFSLSYDTIAKRLGKGSSTVHNIVRLLQLPAAAKEALASEKITEGHARAILSLKGDDERQAYLLKTIIDQGWNVRQAERFVISVKSGIVEKKQASARTQTETPATKMLSQKLGTPVQVRRMANGGKLEITFNSDEELDRIINLFS
jgi:ParB family chromosome partitioning protein